MLEEGEEEVIRQGVLLGERGGPSGAAASEPNLVHILQGASVLQRMRTHAGGHARGDRERRHQGVGPARDRGDRRGDAGKGRGQEIRRAGRRRVVQR